MIGPLHPATTPVLAMIHAAAFPAAEAWPERAFATLLGNPGMIGVIEDTGGGFALARLVVDEAELLTLAVMPDRRRAGLGRALLGALIGQLEAAGAARLFLEVSEQNDAAQALYAGFGFRRNGERARYYRDGSAAWLMDLRLAPGPGPARLTD